MILTRCTILKKSCYHCVSQFTYLEKEDSTYLRVMRPKCEHNTCLKYLSNISYHSYYRSRKYHLIQTSNFIYKKNNA